MSATYISFTNVSKYFTIKRGGPQQIKHYLVLPFNRRNFTARYEYKSVLDDVSFKIGPGEFVGIMGRNGAGKSTLLKLISGIYTPSSGAIDIGGRIAPVLELGAGFAIELNGVENIFLNASILGYSKKLVEARLKDIIEFSELGEEIYQPVRNYSSGMLVRLAFSIACYLDAPILLFDEVLAVGDLGFQKKCLEKIQQLHKAGKTIVLVTHSPEAIRENCDRCIVIDHGKIIHDGSPTIGGDIYTELFQ